MRLEIDAYQKREAYNIQIIIQSYVLLLVDGGKDGEQALQVIQKYVLWLWENVNSYENLNHGVTTTWVW